MYIFTAIYYIHSIKGGNPDDSDHRLWYECECLKKYEDFPSWTKKWSWVLRKGSLIYSDSKEPNTFITSKYVTKETIKTITSKIVPKWGFRFTSDDRGMVGSLSNQIGLLPESFITQSTKEQNVSNVEFNVIILFFKDPFFPYVLFLVFCHFI